MTSGGRVEFDSELATLRSSIVRMGAMVNETISRGTAALLNRDLRAAQELIDADDLIDQLALEVEEHVYRLLALQAPVAADLRFVVTALRAASELERSADLIINVCKSARRIYDVEIPPRLRGLIAEMAEESAALIRSAIDAFVESDVVMARALDDIDDRLDDLQRTFVEELIGANRDDAISLRASVQLALIARYYERIGDHAVNIGERVIYMATGALPEAVVSSDLTFPPEGPG